MNKITEAITEVLVKNLVIEEEKRELCIYGIGLMISSVIDILLILIISAFLHRFIETLIYLFAFIPLRLYAGGYHAGSEAKCLGIFIGVFILFILTIELLPIFLHFWVILFSIVVGFVFVILFAPIENCNKPLNSSEFKAYRNISRILISVETLIIVICMIISRDNIYLLSFCLGELSVVISMFAAMIKKYFQKRRYTYEKA